MSTTLVLARTGRFAVRSEPCVFCVAHQLRRPIHHHALRQGPSRPRTSPDGGLSTCSSKSIQSRRFASPVTDTSRYTLESVETRNRIGIFTMLQRVGQLKIKPADGVEICKEFDSRGRVDPVTKVAQLATSQFHFQPSSQYGCQWH
jgi:hypothetical protein